MVAINNSRHSTLTSLLLINAIILFMTSQSPGTVKGLLFPVNLSGRQALWNMLVLLQVTMQSYYTGL